MMKLKVVDDYRRVEVVEAVTIDNLKARIMERFSLKEKDMSERLLVRDGRVIPAAGLGSPMPMVNGCDLLDLKEGSILKEHFCRDCLDDGDTLLLGWKGPFIVRLVLSDALSLCSAINSSLDIEVDPYQTLGHLKGEIVKVTGEAVTRDNLPTILVDGDDDKPLIFYGFYNYYKGLKGRGMAKFYINRNSENKLVVRNSNSLPSFCTYRAVPEMPCYFGMNKDSDALIKDLKIDTMDQYGDEILVPLTEFYNQKKMNKGMGGDNEDTGPSYKLYRSQPSTKDMENLSSTFYENLNG